MNKLKEINKLIAKELWFDFEVKSFDGSTLIIVGGLDLFYNWMLELTFTDVAFVSLRSDWQRQDNIDFIEVIPNDKEDYVRQLYFIEDKYLIFVLSHLDLNVNKTNQYIIAAIDVDYRVNQNP